MASKGAKKASLHSLSRQPLSSEADKENYWKTIFDSKQNDRIVAIRASAYVEHSLLNLLVTAMRAMTEEENEAIFFGPHATLSDFASRIDVAYAFGLVSLEERRDLDTIRKIRNVFAHAIIDVEFDQTLISAECSKFDIIKEGSTARQQYLFSAHDMVIKLLEKLTDMLKRQHAAALTQTSALLSFQPPPSPSR
jgi:hypothetical protein